MTTLYIDRKDMELRHEGHHILLYEQGRRAGSVPVSHLERVVIHRQARLETGVLGLLAEEGVGLVVINPRYPQRTAHLIGNPHNDVLRRLQQYRRHLDTDWRRLWCKSLIRHKLRKQRRLLERALGRRPDQRHALIKGMQAIETRLASLGEEGITVDTIRGIEGAAAAAYFRAFQAVFPPSLSFKGRNRRPPRDPVNACLSLGYTLQHAEAVRAVHAAGLDPLLGYFHEPYFGRASLAADLIEPLRPRLDSWVWWLFRERVLRQEDFSQDRGAVLLRKASRQTFYRTYEPLAREMRRHLRRHARLLAKIDDNPLPGAAHRRDTVAPDAEDEDQATSGEECQE